MKKKLDKKPLAKIEGCFVCSKDCQFGGRVLSTDSGRGSSVPPCHSENQSE